jgi:hypothetical protein
VFRLAILAVQKVAHRLPPSRVRFTHSLALVSVHGALRYGRSYVGKAACRTAVGKTGFIRLKLELLLADLTDFGDESHLNFMIRRCKV